MTIHAVAVETAVFIDRKKSLWPIAVCCLSLPAFACYFALVTENGLLFWLVPVAWFGFVPLLDRVLPFDDYGPSDEGAASLDTFTYYARVVGLAVPAVYASVIYCIWVAAEDQLPWHNLVGIGLSLGIVIGMLMTIGQVYAGRESRWARTLSFLSTAIIGCGYLRVAHSAVHQHGYATPTDPLSARMGEDLYKFSARLLRGCISRDLDLEKVRLGPAVPLKALINNDVFRGLVFAAILYGALLSWAGIGIAPLLVVMILSAWFFHTAVLYIQHYGLLREKHRDGTYVPGGGEHSWVSAHAVSGLLLFNAMRHADVHLHPGRGYQSMGVDRRAPALPYGYPLAIMLAAVPPLWFRCMDARVARWAQGDLLKVNIDGGAYADLMAQHHRPGG